MTSTIQKWGNSLALRIPSPLAKDFHIHQGTEVDLALIDGKIIIEAKSRRKISLAGLLKNVTDKNLHTEQFDGVSVGRETL